MSLHIPKWVPFKIACAMRALQQGARNVGNRQQNRAALLALATTQANAPSNPPWARWNTGNNSNKTSSRLLLNVPLAPGFVPPVGTNDDSV